MFTSILNNRLQKYLDSNNIINSCQIGVQPKARTTDHMFILRTLIEKYASNKSKLNARFVDFEKAFDSVLQSALFHKWTQLDIKGPFCDILRHMYLEILSHVRMHDSLMDTFAPQLGVRQGNSLRPNLFKICINDLPNMFVKGDDPVQLDNIYITSLCRWPYIVVNLTTRSSKLL